MKDNFGLKDKLAYASGDLGCNMSFALKSTLTIFWTQFMGLDSVLFATLLLIVQCWDAINDPMIGILIDKDKRRYRLGKLKTYILVGSIGLLFSSFLCFLPLYQLSTLVKSLIFLFGYILWDGFYTLVNVPYGSLINTITADQGERAQLSAWRNVGAMVAGVCAGIFVPILIYDKENNLKGNTLFIISIIMGLLGLCAFIFLLVNTKERVVYKERSDSKKGSILSFFKNRPAIGATLAACTMYINMGGSQVASTILFQSYFKNAQLTGVMQFISYLPMLIFIPFVKRIIDKYGKKEASSFGALLSIFTSILFFILPMKGDSSGIAIYFVILLLNGFCMGFFFSISYSMIADSIDYYLYKYNKRDEALTYAMHSFFRKLFQGVAPSFGLIAATKLGYDQALKANQTLETALNMKTLVGVCYLIASIVAYISIRFIYNLDKRSMKKINQDLNLV